MANTIGQQIRKYRKEKGMTQKQLADLLDTTQQNLAQYENGKRNPKIETLKKIAQALEIPLIELQDIDSELEIKVPYAEKLSEFSRSDRIFIDMMVESIKKELPDLFDDDDEINKKITENLNTLLNSVNGRVDSLDDAKKFFENELASKLMHYFNLSAPKDKVEIVNFAKYTALKSNNHKED